MIERQGVLERDEVWEGEVRLTGDLVIPPNKSLGNPPSASSVIPAGSMPISKGNGDVFRCGQDAFGQRPMGNIFDPGFRLHDVPQPCPSEQCSCLEFKYLEEVMSQPPESKVASGKRI